MHRAFEDLDPPSPLLHLAFPSLLPSFHISPHPSSSPYLCCAVLCCAVLCCAVLCCAVLCCAVLCCAVLCCAVFSLNGFHSAYFQSHPHVTSTFLILRSALCNMLHATFEQICIFLFQSDEVRDRRRRGDNEMKQGARQEQRLGQGQDQDPLPPQLSMEHVMPLLQRSVSQSVM